MTPFRLGDIIHGFCGGAFGRDSYNCRRVEAVGADWVVTRNERGEVELVAGARVPTREEGGDLSYCYMGCIGPEEA
jgi:hypothetical protein